MQGSFGGQIKTAIMTMLPATLRGRMRAWRVKNVIANWSERVVEHRYGTGPLRVALTDPMAAGWYDSDWDELPEITLLRAHSLRPGRLVFDVGAHHGVVAMMLAREVAPDGRVVALEASPHNARTIRRNLLLNDVNSITVIQSAITDAPGALVFNEGLNGQIDDGSGAWGQIEVDATTIDLIAERFGDPDIVFLDIEGAEHLALAGAARTLETAADWFVEVHARHGLEKLGGSVGAVLAHFPTDRYDAYIRAEDDRTFRSLSSSDPCLSDRFFLVAICRAK